MHNALRGAERKLTDREKEVYLTYSTRNTHLRPLVRAYPNIVHWAELAQCQRELYE
jgi:hypothetical protein